MTTDAVLKQPRSFAPSELRAASVAMPPTIRASSSGGYAARGRAKEHQPCAHSTLPIALVGAIDCRGRRFLCLGGVFASVVPWAPGGFASAVPWRRARCGGPVAGGISSPSIHRATTAAKFCTAAVVTVAHWRRAPASRATETADWVVQRDSTRRGLIEGDSARRISAPRAGWITGPHAAPSVSVAALGPRGHTLPEVTDGVGGERRDAARSSAGAKLRGCLSTASLRSPPTRPPETRQY
jgi:hypothetical protein